VDISFDPAKNARNTAVHGISLERAMDFDWHGAINWQDTRRDYGEQRYLALGRIGTRVHVLVYTPREARMHIISLRKANKREVRRYEDEAKDQEGANGSRQPGMDRTDVS
jgi:uncharacterized DUF497 family protein